MRGAYTEWLVDQTRHSQGWATIIGRAGVNDPGYDLVLQQGNVVRLVEAKAVNNALPISRLENYFGLAANGTYTFKLDYFIEQDLLNNPITRAALQSGNLQVEVFVNSAESTKIIGKLTQELNGTLTSTGGQAVIQYLDNVGHPQTLQIILTAINQ